MSLEEQTYEGKKHYQGYNKSVIANGKVWEIKVDGVVVETHTVSTTADNEIEVIITGKEL